MTPDAAMIMLLLERGVCRDTGGSFWHEHEKIVTLRCAYQAPELHPTSPYRVQGYDRG